MARQILLSEGEFMDFIFDIIVPRSDIDNLNLRELFINWGEESFSQDPPQYANDYGLTFVQNKDMEYYKRWNGKFADSNLYSEAHIALSLTGSHVSDLEWLVNNHGNEISSNKLILFLEALSTLNYFVIFFIRDEEYIDNSYKVCARDEIVDKICNSLSWSSPEGVVLIKA